MRHWEIPFCGFSLAATSTRPIPVLWPVVLFSTSDGKGLGWGRVQVPGPSFQRSDCSANNTVGFCFLRWPGGLIKPDILVSGEWRSSLNFATGHGLWVQRYQEKKSLFDVPESDGTSLSPVTAAVYSFLTMIIVLQVTVLSSIWQLLYFSDENFESS